MFPEVEEYLKKNPPKEKEFVVKTMAEILNEINGEELTTENWKNWSYFHKVTACDFQDMTDNKYVKRVSKRFIKKCDGDCYKCLDTFFSEKVKVSE